MFVLPVVPIAVLYKPPPPGDPTLVNSSAFSEQSEIGTRISTSYARGKSTSTPQTPVGWERRKKIHDAIELEGQALSAVPASVNPHAGVIGARLEQIAGLMGKISGSKQNASATVHDKALEIKVVTGRGCDTSLRAGPGLGDVIFFLERARVVWFDNGRRTRLALLGADFSRCLSARLLRERLADAQHREAAQRRKHQKPTHPGVCVTPPRKARAARAAEVCSNRVSAQNIASLLAQDPFVAGGPQAHLDPQRFEQQTGISAEEAAQTFSQSATVSSDDTHALTESTITTEDFTKGLLSFVGVGPAQTKTLTSTVTSSSAVGFRKGKTVATALRIEGMPAGVLGFDVFYDRLYGTFALTDCEGIECPGF